MKRRTRRTPGLIRDYTLDPDEVLLDAFNLPSFDTDQFEGRVERSLQKHVPLLVGGAVALIFAVFLVQAWNLQVVRGEALAVLSANNSLDHEILFAKRGVLSDRHGVPLAWNASALHQDGSVDERAYALRRYHEGDGFSHILGFLNYPEQDSDGNWWRSEYIGRAGVEQSFNERLSGENGVRLIEVDALGAVRSANTIDPPENGENITLSIDAAMQQALFAALRDGAHEAGFVAGLGIVMDVHTGELLALTNYPEYTAQAMTDGTDTEAIAAYAADERQPFLNRALLGEYSPGSIVKPYVVAAALNEGLIAPEKEIHSTGEIRIPNPYVPGAFTVFRDWRTHGWVDAREALAVSSNIYFYAISGGFEAQRGLGIGALSEYARRFGLGAPTGISFDAEASGVVPTPEWKARVFGEDDPWSLGNTYHTAIGQFGFLTTPIQAVRYIAAVANGGWLVTPRVYAGGEPHRTRVGVLDAHLAVVREGMQRAAETGTAVAVNVPGMRIAAKTGTAEVGVNNEHMHSWVVGFWPADEPQFAFAALLERAPAETLRGAAPAMRAFFEYLVREQPEYARGEYPVHEPLPTPTLTPRDDAEA